MSKFKQLIESCIGPEQAKEALATSIVESDCEGKEEMKKSERSSNPYHKGHANTAFTRLENAKEAGISGFRDIVEGQLNEQIKGWKHAHSDLAKERKAASNYKMSAVLHTLKKDGTESKMHDARQYFSSEQEARAQHERVKKLNPSRSIKHALYVDGKHIENLGESEAKTFRELVEESSQLKGGEKAAYKMGQEHARRGTKLNDDAVKRSFGDYHPYYHLGHKHMSSDIADSEHWHSKQRVRGGMAEGAASHASMSHTASTPDQRAKHFSTAVKRVKGIAKATDRLVKESDSGLSEYAQNANKHLKHAAHAIMQAANHAPRTDEHEKWMTVHHRAMANHYEARDSIHTNRHLAPHAEYVSHHDSAAKRHEGRVGDSDEDFFNGDSHHWKIK